MKFDVNYIMMKRYKNTGGTISPGSFSFVINHPCTRCSSGRQTNYENGLSLEGKCDVCDGESEIQLSINIHEIGVAMSDYISSNPNEISKFIDAFGRYLRENPVHLLSMYLMIKTVLESQVQHVVDS